MDYSKCIAMCGAILVASAAIATVAMPAEGKPPIVVTGPSAETLTRYVSYRDLNLASKAGEKALRRRVNTTASEICYELNADFSVYAIIACRSEALHDARPQIRQAVLRAQQLASTGQSLATASVIALNFTK